MASRPLAVWGAKIPKGDQIVPVEVEVPCDIRITMAAIDPTAEPRVGDVKFATLRMYRRPLSDMLGEDEDDEDDEDREEDEEESEEEEEKPTKGGKAGKKAATTTDKMEIDELKSPKGKKVAERKDAKKDEESDEDDLGSDDDEEDDYENEFEGLVVCTLDNQRTYQQPIDISVGAEEVVFFKVTGDYDVYVTGNYIEYAPPHYHGEHDDSDEDSEDEDRDLSPSEDDMFPYGDDSDDLDELDDPPRIQEIHSDDEQETTKKSNKKAEKAEKNKKKRPADSDEEAQKTLDDLLKSTSEKLSKKDRKKLKANDGKAVDAPAAAASESTPSKNDKKVKFAKDLEQGPTGSAEKPKPTKPEQKADAKKPGATTTGPQKVNGVTVDDKTIGTGPQAKKGQKVFMRYIGKTSNGKVFDSNTKGKPFSFQLGKGEVIKGWEIGILGMQKGGERRLVIPPELAYGKQGTPGIPANSTLTFDVKCLEIK